MSARLKYTGLFDLFFFKVNEAMVGLKNAEAGSEVIVAKKQKQRAVLKEDFEEEWYGITADM